MPTIPNPDISNKKEPRYRCSHCGSPVTIRYGTYPRAHPEQDILIRVKRFLCKSSECPRVTFSVLQHPFLPIVRHFYKTLLLCHIFAAKDQLTQAEIARRLGVTRGVARRLQNLVRQVIPWLQQEKKIAIWGDDPASYWQSFTRDFSQRFYLWRCWGIRPT